MALVCGWHFCHPKEENKQNFLQHISADLTIQFTVENNKEDGAIPILDTIVKPENDGKLSITVYRKPMHMDQCLQWDSHHHLSAKYSVINTLTHRAKTACTNPELLQKEMEHFRKALTNCNYPKWALNKVEKDLPGLPGRLMMGLTAREPQAPSPLPMKSKPRVIPYTQHLCKSIKKICGRYGIQTLFKGNSTIKNLLVSPKDKDPMVNKSGAIYWF